MVLLIHDLNASQNLDRDKHTFLQNGPVICVRIMIRDSSSYFHILVVVFHDLVKYASLN